MLVEIMFEIFLKKYLNSSGTSWNFRRRPLRSGRVFASCVFFSYVHWLPTVLVGHKSNVKSSNTWPWVLEISRVWGATAHWRLKKELGARGPGVCKEMVVFKCVVGFFWLMFCHFYPFYLLFLMVCYVISVLFLWFLRGGQWSLFCAFLAASSLQKLLSWSLKMFWWPRGLCVHETRDLP